MSESKLNKHEIRIDRAFAQGDVSQATKTLVRVIDGQRVVTKIKVNSPNQERMNDALVGYFQDQVRSSFNYFEFREEVLEDLDSKFKEHKLNVPNLGYKEKRIRAAAIQQKIDEKILDKFVENPRMDIDFNEMIKLSNLKSAKSFKNQAEVLLSITGRSAREVKKDIIDFDTMTIKETSFSKRLEIIGVDIILDEEIGAYFPNIEDFMKADINPLDNKVFRNKKKYVKRVGIIFSKEVVPHIICQGSDYVSLDQSVRQKFSLHNTYAIDTYITSIQHAQEYKQLTDFTPDNLQKKFGHSYNRFDRYIKNIIDPCIEDFNKHDHRTLSYTLKRKGYEWGDENAINAKTSIEKFRWIISGYEKSLRDGVNSLHYYIALSILSKDIELKNKFSSVKAFAMSIAEQLDSDIPTLTILANKTIEEWLKEAKYEIDCEDKVLGIFKYSNLVDVLYDVESMSLISSKFDVLDVSKPSESLEYLKEKLKVSEPKKKKLKAIAFPSGDASFVEKILNSAIELEFRCAMHFYFTFLNFYKGNGAKNKDWESVANTWLSNGRYDSKKDRSFKFKMMHDDIEYTGEWNQMEFEIDTDKTIFQDVDSTAIAKLIASGNIKPIGYIN